MADSMEVDDGAAAAKAPRPSPLFNYVVSAQAPTAVTHAVVGHFTSAGDVNLILGKSTHIEIITLTPEGLQVCVLAGIWGAGGWQSFAQGLIGVAPT